MLCLDGESADNNPFSVNGGRSPHFRATRFAYFPSCGADGCGGTASQWGQASSQDEEGPKAQRDGSLQTEARGSLAYGCQSLAAARDPKQIRSRFPERPFRPAVRALVPGTHRWIEWFWAGAAGRVADSGESTAP